MPAEAPTSVADWVAQEAEFLALHAAVRQPSGRIGWIGPQHPLSDRDRWFLGTPPEKLGTLVLEEWPRAHGVPVLLPECAPTFRRLFAEIEESACLWLEDAEGEESQEACYLVRRPNPATGESRFLIFGPGAGEKELAEVAEATGFVLSDDLRSLYGTLGFLQAGGATLHEGLIGLEAGLAVGGVLAEREEWISWCKEVGGEQELDPAAFADYLPVYANGEGDYVVWLGRGREPKEPEMWEFCHDTLELHQGSKTFSRFLEKLLKTVYLGRKEAFEVYE